jgi:hypothetical protein
MEVTRELPTKGKLDERFQIRPFIRFQIHQLIRFEIHQFILDSGSDFTDGMPGAI